MLEKYVSTKHTEMQPADRTDLIKDRIGFTNPNLHRRITTDTEEEAAKYKIGIYDNMHSYRTTDFSTHDEESTTCEIP